MDPTLPVGPGPRPALWGQEAEGWGLRTGTRFCRGWLGGGPGLTIAPPGGASALFCSIGPGPRPYGLRTGERGSHCAPLTGSHAQRGAGTGGSHLSLFKGTRCSPSRFNGATPFADSAPGLILPHVTDPNGPQPHLTGGYSLCRVATEGAPFLLDRGYPPHDLTGTTPEADAAPRPHLPGLTGHDAV